MAGAGQFGGERLGPVAAGIVADGNPCAASRRAVAAPMPLLPPLITATRPSSI